jgi:hypothetical protein
VTFDNNVLRVACERKEEKEEEDARWHISERRWGSSSRSVRLPRTANGDGITAEYDSGVLKVGRGRQGGLKRLVKRLAGADPIEKPPVETLFSLSDSQALFLSWYHFQIHVPKTQESETRKTIRVS